MPVPAVPRMGRTPGGMQVFQGAWFIVARALAGLFGPGAVIALSGCLGIVAAVLQAARWPPVPSPGGPYVRDQVHSARMAFLLPGRPRRARADGGCARLDGRFPGLSPFGVSPAPIVNH